jgi:hypothetical protein
MRARLSRQDLERADGIRLDPFVFAALPETRVALIEQPTTSDDGLFRYADVFLPCSWCEHKVEPHAHMVIVGDPRGMRCDPQEPINPSTMDVT